MAQVEDDDISDDLIAGVKLIRAYLDQDEGYTATPSAEKIAATEALKAWAETPFEGDYGATRVGEIVRNFLAIDHIQELNKCTPALKAHVMERRPEGRERLEAIATEALRIVGEDKAVEATPSHVEKIAATRGGSRER